MHGQPALSVMGHHGEGRPQHPLCAVLWLSSTQAVAWHNVIWNPIRDVLLD